MFKQVCVFLMLMLMAGTLTPKYSTVKFRPDSWSESEMTNLSSDRVAITCQDVKWSAKYTRICVGILEMRRYKDIVYVTFRVKFDNLSSNEVDWLSLSNARMKVGGFVMPVAGGFPQIRDVYPGTSGSCEVLFYVGEEVLRNSGKIEFLCQYHTTPISFSFVKW